MKTLISIAALSLSALIALAADPLSQALQQGLFEEEANHNLEAAIKAYQAVIKQDNDQRKLVATAVFRLGECYRKQNKNAEAIAQYQRLLRDYSDQTVLADLSRQNLVALGAATAPSKAAAFAAAIAAANPEDHEIARLKALFKDSPDLVNVPDSSGLTPLGQAAKDGQLAVASYLLSIHADLEQGARDGKTPLYMAAQNGHKAMVELLLANHADGNARTPSGGTPLHAVAARGFLAVAQVLIAHKADVNTRERPSGYTPLHYAAQNGLEAMTELLLASGADVNAQSKPGYTPLLLAVASRHAALAELLLRKKANVNLANIEARSPLLSAVEQADEGMVKLLLDHGADAQARLSRYEREAPNGPLELVLHNVTPVHVALVVGDQAIVKMLIEHGADINARDSNNATPLFYAVGLDQPALAGLLLTSGASVNAEGTWDERSRGGNPGSHYAGLSPLQLAIEKNEKDMVALLLQHKADIHVTNSFKQTPLLLAAGRWEKDVVAMLIGAGAEVNAMDAYGKTALNYVTAEIFDTPTQDQRNAIAQLLREHGASEDVQRRAFITASRKEKNYSQRIFQKDVDGHNRYTLYEAVVLAYLNNRQDSKGRPLLAFPDLSRVKISRLTAKGGQAKDISVNLDVAFSAGDCSKDTCLEWGDVIDIPEQDHPLNQVWNGLSRQAVQTLEKCLRRQVNIVVKGHTNSLTLLPPQLPVSNPPGPLFFGGNTIVTFNPGNTEPEPVKELRHFGLYDVVLNANVLRASSDVAHIKVRREDPQTHQRQEMIFNLEKPDPHTDLWLRDGDVIEIPEK